MSMDLWFGDHFPMMPWGIIPQLGPKNFFFAKYCIIWALQTVLMKKISKQNC